MARRVTRPMALPLTWLLLHTKVSANAVSFLGMLTAAGAAWCFAQESPLIFFFGALLFQFWYLLDHVDGQIARYRKASSLTGLYFDFLSHYFVNSVIFFALGVHSFFLTGDFGAILLAFGGAFSYALLQSTFDCKYRAYYVGLKAWKGQTVRIPSETEADSKRSSRSLFRVCYSFLYKLCEVHVFMNLLSLTALLNLWAGPSVSPLPLPSGFFLFYAFLLPFVTAVQIFYSVRTGVVDKDFQREFQLLP